MLLTHVVEFEMPVWRIVPFNDQPWLALELRDSDRLSAQFAAVNLSGNALALPPTAGPEPWWVGLQGAAHGNLYVHQFQRQPQVGVSSLCALEAKTGQQAWQQQGLSFLAASSNRVLVQQIDAPDAEVQVLEPKTGKILENGQVSESASETSSATNVSPAVFPATYLPDNPHYATLSSFLQLKLELNIEGPLEYLESDKHIIFSIHLRQEQELGNYLVIFANNGHLRFRRCLAANLSGYAADTFLLFCGKVACVQERKKLLLIDLEN